MSVNQIQCAACGTSISETADGRFPVQCPACGELLVYDDEEEVQPLPDTEPAPIDEMEEVRIRRIVRERRAMVRTVGYHLVAVLACAIFAIRLAVRFFTVDSATAKIGYGAAAILLLLIGWTVAGRYRRLKANTYRTALAEPTTPPDFTSLSDGSHHARDLHRFGRDTH